MYQVRFYKGDYKARQQQANADNCIAYVEHHFNSATRPSVSYSVVVTSYKVSETSKNWGRWYAKEVAVKFNVPLGGDDGILVGGYNGRGNDNLKLTKMPAILLEPLFASNPSSADIIKSEAGQLQLAIILTDSIRKFFPQGGIVAFSIGHKYKTSRPSDLGAALYGGGWEADYAEKVLLKAKDLLENYDQKKVDELKVNQDKQLARNEIRLTQDNEIVWQYILDKSESLAWNPESRELNVKLIIDEDEDMVVKDGILTINLGNSV